MTPALRDLVRSWACNSHDSHLEVLLGHPACTVHACMVDVDRRQRTAGGPEDDGLRKCLPYSNFPGNVNFEVKESRRFKDSQNVFLGDRWRVTCSNIYSAFAWENERLASPLRAQRLPNNITGFVNDLLEVLILCQSSSKHMRILRVRRSLKSSNLTLHFKHYLRISVNGPRLGSHRMCNTYPSSELQGNR